MNDSVPASTTPALDAWRNFAHQYPDRVQLIETAWLYELTLNQVFEIPVRVGPLRLEVDEIRGLPNFVDVVLWCLAGPRPKSVDDPIRGLIFSGLQDAIRFREPETLHVTLGTALIELSAQPPESLGGMTAALLVGMAKELGEEFVEERDETLSSVEKDGIYHHVLRGWDHWSSKELLPRSIYKLVHRLICCGYPCRGNYILASGPTKRSEMVAFLGVQERTAYDVLKWMENCPLIVLAGDRLYRVYGHLEDVTAAVKGEVEA